MVGSEPDLQILVRLADQAARVKSSRRKETKNALIINCLTGHTVDRALVQMGGGQGSGGEAHPIPIAIVLADDDAGRGDADDVPVAAVASPAPSPEKAPSIQSSESGPDNNPATHHHQLRVGSASSTSTSAPSHSPCPEVAELKHLRHLVTKNVPLTKTQAERAKRLIATIVNGPHAHCLADSSLNLAPPNKPSWPPHGIGPNTPIRVRLHAAQTLITNLQYNHTEELYFTNNKDRPTRRVMDTAKSIVREGMPIRCVEAVFVAIFLTAGWHDVERIPLRMRSKVIDDDGVEHSHAHIVLLIRERVREDASNCRNQKGNCHNPTVRYGALGTSRRSELAYVPLDKTSLSAVLEHYRAGYAKWRHRLDGIKIGLPVDHDVDSANPVCWRHVAVDIGKTDSDWSAALAELEAHDAACCGGGGGTRVHFDKWRCDGRLWSSRDGDRRRREGGWHARASTAQAGHRRNGSFSAPSSPVKSPGGPRTPRSARAAAY